MRWYEDLEIALAVQINASDPERVRDDGFELLDRMAASLAGICHPSQVGRIPR